jgi:autotransporter-associated beta strand protein
MLHPRPFRSIKIGRNFTSKVRRLIHSHSVAASFLCLTASLCSAAPPPGYYLVWADEFNGSALDTSKWDYWLSGPRRDAVNTSSAVSVNGGNLVLTTYTSAGTHYTGMIATDGTFRSRYGYWESSIKWGDTNGMWSAFWMQSPTMGANLDDPQVSGSEIDICEHRFIDSGNNNIANQVQVNIHWNGYSPGQSTGSGNVGTGLASGFHTYGVLWTANSYSFSIDGSQVYNGGSSPVSHSTEWAILSSEVDDTSTTWAGQIPAAGYGPLGTSTTKLTVDYVRYYAPTNVLFWTGTASPYWTNSANWISNVPPTSLNDVTFSSLSGNLNNILGTDFSVKGLVFLNLGNGLTINGPNTLTIGSDGIDMVAANHTITINAPINIAANQTWLIGPNNPVNTLNINGNISGASTLTKGSYGTLVLNASNSFSGALNVDTSSTTSSDGIVRVAHPAALANVASPISIRNNNSGSSTLQLSAAAGNITLSQAIALNARSSSVAAIENLSGTNTLAGNITINVGGSQYWFQSDSGQLNLGGNISSIATGTRTLTFMGSGNFLVSGSIQNGSATVGIVKTNSGALTFSGIQTYTGPTIVSNGVLIVNGTLNSSPVTVYSSGTLSGSGIIKGPVTIFPGATLAPGPTGSSSLGALTINNSLTLAGSTLLGLNKSALTNDSVRGLSSISYGGSLTVVNLGSALNAGDAFTLFQSSSYGGAFSSVTLPSLASGLAWYTNSLTNGVISVISTIPPTISSLIQLPDANFQINGAGLPGINYQLLATTNLTAPILWFPVTNQTADGSGSFQFIDWNATNFPHQFYKITGP